MGLQYIAVDYGVFEILGGYTREQRKQLQKNLQDIGFFLLSSEDNILVDKMLDLICESVYYSSNFKLNYADYLSKKLAYDYEFLSNLFMEIKGVSIDKYVSLCKIERVKELLFSGNASIIEIAKQLNYSSISHLSVEFKETTGLSLAFYRQLKLKRDSLLESV